MSNVLTVLATLALAIGTSFVFAQTAPTQTNPANTPPARSPPPTDIPTAPRTNMPTTGAQMMSSKKPPDFTTLDRNGTGFVTQTDVASDPWLSKNFAMCDANHDGQVSR